MIWDASDHWNSRIVEYSGWKLVWNYETLDPRARVYLFANAASIVKCAGKAGPGRMVAEIATAIRRDKD